MSTPVKDIPSLNEGEEKDELELSESVLKSSTENEIKGQESPLIVNENTEEKISVVNDEKNGAPKTETNKDETIGETKCNDLSDTMEIQIYNQKILNEVKNKIEDNSVDYENRDSELTSEIRTNDLELTNETNDNLEPINNVLHLTKHNEIDVIEQHNESIKNLVTSKIVKNENINLNISEEIKILDEATKKSVQLDNLVTEKYLQVNGDISPINCNEAEHSLEGKIISHTSSSDVKDITIKSIEIQNSLNSQLSEELKVINSEESNDKSQLIIVSEPNKDMKEKINDNVANQDSFSNSSDSETIVNSECLQHENNDSNNIENSDKMAVAQPISVITIQTCDTVDSDCSEAYLTPNELNETPKKILEENNVNAIEHAKIVNKGIVSQLNPSIESNNKVEIPSENTSEVIVEQKSYKETINKMNENVNEIVENINKIEENTDRIEKNTDTIETVEIIENCNETEVRSQEDVNIVHRPHEEQDKNIENGIFCSLKIIIFRY